VSLEAEFDQYLAERKKRMDKVTIWLSSDASTNKQSKQVVPSLSRCVIEVKLVIAI
jgi:hypothetical protein